MTAKQPAGKHSNFCGRTRREFIWQTGGGFAGAALAVTLFDFALPTAFGLPHKVALAFVIGLGAAWGDLISSLVKRAAGAKDWGDVLPGHGGLMDRANSLVVVVPLVFYFSYLVM